MDTFLYGLVQGIMMGGVYALIALGFVVILKATKIIYIAYGETMALSAYLCWWLFVTMSFPLWLALILTLLAGILVNLSVYRLIMRPMIGQPWLSMMITTIMLAVVLRGVVTLIWKGQHVPLNIFPVGRLSIIGDVTVSYGLFLSFVVAIVLYILVTLFFRYTRMGLAMRCVGEEHQISQSLGISLKTVFILSWAIGGLIAAIGGIVFGALTVVDLQIGHAGLGRAVPAIMLGGVESVPGALVGGLIVGVTEMLVALFIDPLVGGGLREATPFLLIVLILVVRPEGLWGQKRIERI